MAIPVRRGTQIEVAHTRNARFHDYTYVIEKITRLPEDAGLQLEVRTLRQRAFPRDLVPPTVWTSAYVSQQMTKGKMTILPHEGATTMQTTTTTALIPQAQHLDTLFAAGLLCDVCEERPWTQTARTCDAHICADCAEGEPDEDDAHRCFRCGRTISH